MCGSKEAAYEAILRQCPELPDNPFAHCVFMMLACLFRAERELTASN